MNRPTYKWQRTTTVRTKRKPRESWVSCGQLYREIAAGYEYFMALRTTDETFKKDHP
jgi:hypothetical protein